MLDYMPRLDGLRAVAIIFVLQNHFAGFNIAARVGTGGLGVRLFFVLSGYLITRILLNYRDSGTPIRKAAAHFYWRRLLRLSPALYLAITAGALIGIANLNEEWWVHALYLTNFRIAYTGEWGNSAHFWSLAVEEQFYLVWFFVILCVPRRHLLLAIIVAIGSASLYRLFAYAMLFNVRATVQPLPANIDFLACGALIAYAEIYSGTLYRGIKEVVTHPLAILLSALLTFGGIFLPDSLFLLVAHPLSIAVLSMALIVMAKEPGEDGKLGWLAWRPIRHLGKISYGVYVYHFFVPLLLAKFFADFYGHFSAFPRPIVYFVVNVTLSITIAELSWWLVERPLLDLKNKVPSWLPGWRSYNFPAARQHP
jgi:peptidoglycan/LPS O-acetylase OafA/YrhL